MCETKATHILQGLVHPSTGKFLLTPGSLLHCHTDPDLYVFVYDQRVQLSVASTYTVLTVWLIH